MNLPSPSELLMQAHPFLFLRRATVCTDDRVVCEGHYPADHPVLAGHFPGDPIVPGVLLVEGLAQTLAYWSRRRDPEARLLLTGVDRCRFRRQVRPDEPITFEVAVERELMGTVHGHGTGEVAGQVCVSLRLIVVVEHAA